MKFYLPVTEQFEIARHVEISGNKIPFRIPKNLPKGFSKSSGAGDFPCFDKFRFFLVN